MWELEIGDRPSVRPAIFTMAERARERYGLTLRHMTRRSLRSDLDLFAEVYNAAWAGNWGFVPYSKEDLDAYALDLQLVFDPKWFQVVETADGDVVGVAMSPLDVNQVLQKMHGSLLPFGWFHYLNRQTVIDRIRVGFLGVKPEYQHTGAAAMLYVENYDCAVGAKQHWAEAGWILEHNSINKAMAALGGRVVKRYRVYERAPAGSCRRCLDRLEPSGDLGRVHGVIEDDAPEVDALPVLAEPTTIVSQREQAPVAMQAAVVAATSFVAGVATIAVVRSHPLRRMRMSRRRRKETRPRLASRSFLVDVHVLGDKR